MTASEHGPKKPSLGLIGVGLMGLPMTLRLLECGYGVNISGREPNNVSAAVAKGAHACESPAEVTTRSEIVLLCVTDVHAVEDVVFGPNGVAQHAAAGKTLVDHTTADASRTRELATRLERDTGMGWVDAPVSGGPPAALEGTLALMAGGKTEHVERVRPVMTALGRFTHLGPSGSGQVTKMVNQIIAGVTFAVLAEATKMAENAGIDASKLPECLAGGYADSTMLQRILPRMAARQFEPPAGLAKQLLKDLEMVAELGKATNTPTPMAAQAAVLYRLMVARGMGTEDTIALLKLYDAGA
jgi:3-hydroxyisobutyrate dehydrogenase